MLIALLSSVLRMQVFFIVGIDALFLCCAEKGQVSLHMNMVSKKMCSVLNFIQNSEPTCFLANFSYAFEVTLFLVFQFVVKIFLALCLSTFISTAVIMMSKQQYVPMFSSFPGGQVVFCIPHSLFLPKTTYVIQACYSSKNIFSMCLT